jgi:hypothetical protein
MNIENVPKNEPRDAEKELELTPALQEIMDRELHFDEDKFNMAAQDKRSASREVSEDAFVRSIRAMVKWLEDGKERPLMERSLYGTMLRILKRDSMKGHPDMELFESAVQDIAKLDRYELKL